MSYRKYKKAQLKKYKWEVKKVSEIERRIIRQWLGLPFSQRFRIALRIIRGLKK